MTNGGPLIFLEYFQLERDMTSVEAETARTKIAIIGGGIGGLTLALALSRRDCSLIEVDLYESASQLTERGAGITIWHRTWDILSGLGMEQDMKALLPYDRSDEPTLTFQFRKGDQAKGFGFHELITNGGPINFHRVDFKQAILRNIPESMKKSFHLSRSLVSYSECPDKVDLVFSDGSTASCDILIGADGIKSSVRRDFLTQLAGGHHSVNEAQTERYAEGIEPVWSGGVAYRGFAPLEVLEQAMPNHRAAKRPTQYWGKDKHVVAYPISQSQGRKLVNVIAQCSDMSKEGTAFEGPWVTEVTTENVARLFSGWDPEVTVLFNCFESASRWAIHTVKPLEAYVSRRVALLGDSAHAMTPNQGAGAGQAIEDAYILASLITAPGPTTQLSAPVIAQILETYDSIRRPAATRVQAASRAQGLVYDFNSPGFEGVDLVAEGDERTSPERLKALAEELIEKWKWLWTSSAEVDCERAVAELQSCILKLK
ncbi:hypothetical protein HGRIS_001860 [Hohenbuehelia grisea]|uniref:FAD-binding domain-containing protein n=1 Tax=Hohenbuehelia grisea TaxID=104357 RepID=A0ABR3JJD7_9AGAR